MSYNRSYVVYKLQRYVLFCAYHKIKTLAEFLEITKGKSER